MRDTDPMGGFVQHRNILQIKIQILIMLKIQIASMTILMQPKTINFSLTAEHVVTSTSNKVVTTTRTPPGMQLSLNKSF
jgi:hypothetical protein